MTDPGDYIDFNEEEPEGEVLLIAVPVETKLFEQGLSVDEITEALVEAAYFAVKAAVEFQLEKREEDTFEQLRPDVLDVTFEEHDDRED